MAPNTVSPAYCAESVCAPICKDDVVKDDDPFTSGTEPMRLKPSTNRIFPVAFAGEPRITDNTAVKVSGLP